MNLKKFGILLIVLVLVYVALSRFWEFKNSTAQNMDHNNQETEWALNTSFGFPVWVGLNHVGDPLGRSMFLFIEAQDFTEDNLERVFTGLAAEYSDPQYLHITAYSNREMLQRAIKYRLSPTTINFGDTPEGRISQEIWAEKVLPLKTGYFRADYSRFNGEERFSYSPDPAKEDRITVILKERVIPYTGESDSDLVLAVIENDMKRVRELLKNGANVNAKDNYGDTVLMIAVSKRHIAILETLIAKGANVNFKNRKGGTALTYAAGNKETNIVKALLASGAEVNVKNDNDYTPLILASVNGQTDNVKALLVKGADIEARDRKGNTSLMKAALNGHGETVKALLIKGADVNARNNDGRTALMLAHNHKETVEALLNEGADVDAKDNYGWTALMHATDRYYIDKVRLLLEKGAIVNARNNQGETALTIAKRKLRYEQLIQLLKNAGAIE